MAHILGKVIVKGTYRVLGRSPGTGIRKGREDSPADCRLSARPLEFLRP